MGERIQLDGLTPEEILQLPRHEIDALILCDAPLVFTAGTAEVLGQFRVVEDLLVMELAQIDGGGEGVLPTLWRLAERYAWQHSLSGVDWQVHAVTCALPNLKLRRVLDRMGFVIEEVPKVGEVYRLVRMLGSR